MAPFARVYAWFVVACTVACSSDAQRTSSSHGGDSGVSEGSPNGGSDEAGGANASGGARGGSPSAGGRQGASGASGGGAASGSGARTSSGTGGASSGGVAPIDAGADAAEPTAVSLLFGPYKDTSIAMNWNTNVVSTNVSGNSTPLSGSLTVNGGNTVTLAFATGECASESWAGVAGDAIASVNVPLLSKANVRYVVSTGGAAGAFTCGSDSGFETFVGRWMSSGLVGVDFDIEAGQSASDVENLIRRAAKGHAGRPDLRFSFTLATLANNDGASTATALGRGVQDSFNTYGDRVMAALESVAGFARTAASWPAYLTVNLMTMDYGSPGSGVCVVSGGACQMAESAIQAVYNLHDRWGVPYDHIEVTPMIGVNDLSGEKFTLDDVDVVAAFAVSHSLAGVHYWSYDRDNDCPVGAASPTCNSMGAGYAGPAGYLKRFLGKLR